MWYKKTTVGLSIGSTAIFRKSVSEFKDFVSFKISAGILVKEAWKFSIHKKTNLPHQSCQLSRWTWPDCPESRLTFFFVCLILSFFLVKKLSIWFYGLYTRLAHNAHTNAICVERTANITQHWTTHSNLIWPAQILKND